MCIRDRVYIEGRIKTRKWTGEDGNDRYTTEINVDDFTFLSNKGGEISEETGSSNETSPSVSQEVPPDDDLPF